VLNHRGLRFVHLMLDECLALVHKLCFVHVDNCNFFFYVAREATLALLTIIAFYVAREATLALLTIITLAFAHLSFYKEAD